MANKLGDRIRYYLKKGGYTQQELADELGLTSGGLSHKLSGKNPWQAHELSLTAEFVGIAEDGKRELIDLAYESNSIWDHGRGYGSRQRATTEQHPLASQMRVRQFRHLIDERTKSFVGRSFVFRAIQDYIDEPAFSSGYVVIRGEPGIGKTALLAQFVRDNDCVHHFNIAAQNIRSPQAFLANVCAQIIVRYDLNYQSLPAEALQDSGFLLQVLDEAISKEGERRIVIAVDALDEAERTGIQQGENPLLLPQVLPKGVHFVVTSRHKEADHLSVTKRRDIHLHDKDPQNLADVRRFIASYVSENRLRMTDAISKWNVKEDQFLDVITAKSDGNFMYLVYVLDDICSGRLSAGDLDTLYGLPAGLRAYYEQHWGRMRSVDAERFDRYYEPVVCILATVREPISVLQVAEITKLPIPRVNEVISEWRSFLNVVPIDEGELVYHIYHDSFRDFLEDRIGLMQYHGLIATEALAKISWHLPIQ